MTTGALLFAYNTDQIDYVRLAAWTAANIRRHLGIPVALVTDQPTDHEFDHVVILESQTENRRWFDDLGSHVIWKNDTRPLAYDVTPWQKTLVLDVDYIVASDQLKQILDLPVEFLAHRWAFDITGKNDFQGLNYFGDHHMPQWWATVMVFEKCRHAQLIFDSMKMVRDNWTHYRYLYNNHSKSYRNDHALSIALNTVDGHIPRHAAIPWPLASLVPEHALQIIDQDRYRVEFIDTQNKKKWVEISNQDFHAMGKKHLQEIAIGQS